MSSSERIESETAAILGNQPLPSLGDYLAPEQFNEPENAFLKVLDFLRRGEYLAANTFRWVLGREGLHPLEALGGKRKSDFVDVAHDLGFNGAAAKTFGFVGGVFLDPTTYLGVGALTKAGRLAKIAKGGGIETAEQLAKLEGKIGKELRLAQEAGIDVLKFGETAAERAELGQQAVFTFMGKSVTPDWINEPALRFAGKTADWYDTTKASKFIRNVFSSKTGIPKLDKVIRDNMDLHRSVASDAVPLFKGLEDLEMRLPEEAKLEIVDLLQTERITGANKLLGMTKEDGKVKAILAKHGFSAEDQKTYLEMGKDVYNKVLDFEKMENVPTPELRNLDYLPWIMTKRGEKMIKDIKMVPENPKDIRQYSNFHVSMLERNFPEGITDVEINRRGRAGKLSFTNPETGEVIKVGKLDYDIFDTSLANRARSRWMRMSRGVASSRMLSAVEKDWGVMVTKQIPETQGFAGAQAAGLNLATPRTIQTTRATEARVASEIPPGYVHPSNPYFHPDVYLPGDVAKVVDQVYGQLINSDEVNSMLKGVNWFTKIWKTTTTAFPSTGLRNLIQGIHVNTLNGAWKNPEAASWAARVIADSKDYAIRSNDLFDVARLKGSIKDTGFKDGLTGQDITSDQALKMMKEDGIISAGRLTSEAGLRQTFKEAPGENLLSKLGAGGKAVSKAVGKGYDKYFDVVGKVTDDWNRAWLWRDAMERGLSREGAKQEVLRWHGDWFNFSPIERQVLAPIFPFYNWMKINLPRQLELLVTKPKAIGVLGTAKGVIEKGQEKPDPESLPEWLRRSSPVQWRRGAKGQSEYLVGANWVSAADLQLLADPVGLFKESLTPILKEPWQQLQNADFYFKTKIQRFPGEYQEWLGMPMNARLTHVLRNIRLLNVANKIAFPSSQAAKDPVGERFVSSAIRPIPFFDIDLAKENKYRTIEKQNELSALNKELRRNIFYYNSGQKKEAALKNLDNLQEMRQTLEQELAKLKVEAYAMAQQ